MTYLQRLEEASSLLCLGLDPVPSRLPDGFTADRFLTVLLEEAEAQKLLPSTLKPNLAYFEQFGWRGWQMLEALVNRWSEKCIIILDAKRGDIGRSSEAYAKAMFDALRGDSVTLHPWMGPDSVQPFLDYLPHKGGYLLLRTSNAGGDVLQASAWKELYTRIDEWDPSGQLGFVVGATRPSELEWVVERNASGRPLLIPGVGAQGGSATETVAVIRSGSYPKRHRVNISSAILYAHEAPDGRFPHSNLNALREYQEVFSL